LFIKHPNIVGVIFLLGQNGYAMSSPSFQIPSFKISIAAIFVAALGFSHSTAEAVIVVDDVTNTPGYRDNLNGYDAYYQVFDENKSNSGISLDTFLTTDGAGDSIEVKAWNDGDNTEAADNIYVKNTGSSDGGSSLTLAEAGALIFSPIDGDSQEWVAFYLSANQQGSSTDNFYGISKLDIYTSGLSDVEDIDTFAAADEAVRTLAYSFDADRADEGNDTGELQLFYGTGNSNWDVVLYVPLAELKEYGGSQETTYIQFVVEYTDTAGSDSWQYNVGTGLVPEPSSALLVALGGLMGLLRRRR